MQQLTDIDLKNAFTSYASTIPAEAGVRVRTTEYHPRSSRLSPRLTIGALSGAVATAGTVISVVVLGGASPAFAGWTASPTTASPAQLSTASTNCQSQLTNSPAYAGSGGTDDSDWTTVTTDARGPYTVVIYQDGSSYATCFNGPGFTTLSRTGGGFSSNSMSSNPGGPSAETGSASSGTNGSSSVSLGTDLSGGITHVSVSHLHSADGDYTLIEGELKSDVTAVSLDRNDGSDVQATTGSGWFVAWWPSTAGVTSAQVTSAGGTATQTLPQEPPMLSTPPDVKTGTCGQSNSADTQGPVTCTGGPSSATATQTNGS
ncbi:MAG TPA: hypothetical protein VGH31_01540 [Acidimicrobiales bacterium]|jgi:hypothetical protein